VTFLKSQRERERERKRDTHTHNRALPQSEAVDNFSKVSFIIQLYSKFSSKQTLKKILGTAKGDPIFFKKI